MMDMHMGAVLRQLHGKNNSHNFPLWILRPDLINGLKAQSGSSEFEAPATPNCIYIEGFRFLLAPTFSHSALKSF